MPTPKEGETQEEFVERCIPIVIEDETADNPKQAVAICGSMWRTAQKAIYGNEVSQEEELREIEGAFSHAFPSSGAVQPPGDFYPWVAATYAERLIIELSGKYYAVAYTREGDDFVFAPFDEWEPVDKLEGWATKAHQHRIKSVLIKAVGDWQLDVLAVPFGGPHRGRDADGEYFNAETNLYLDTFDKPIVSYYHGFDPQGYPQGEPETIGEVVSRESKSDGLWVRVLLDKASEYAKRVWEAAKEGLARASSGTIEHIRRVDQDGRITHWPFVELALLDTDGERRPANAYAVALPVMKAAYKQAGKDWPEIQDPQVKAEAKRQSAETDLSRAQTQARAREFLLGD